MVVLHIIWAPGGGGKSFLNGAALAFVQQRRRRAIMREKEGQCGKRG